MAKFEVTQRGVHGVEKGEVIEIDGDKVPAWLVNKGRVLEAEKVITNPAKASDAKAAK